ERGARLYRDPRAHGTAAARRRAARAYQCQVREQGSFAGRVAQGGCARVVRETARRRGAEQNFSEKLMKAGVSSPNGLELRDIPQPVPKPNEVLTRVKACGLNRADLSAAKASLGHGVMGAALGLEWAGEVAAVGAEVKEFKPGDRVVASGSGGYA